MKHPVAFITGAPHRLGRAFALTFAQQGFDLWLHYHTSADEARKTAADAEKLGARVLLAQANLNHVQELENSINNGLKHFQRCDVLINNAAIFQRKPLLEISESDWDQTVDLNLKACLFTAKAVIPQMLRQKSGQIINMASVGGLIPYQHHLPYGVSKAGLIMLTKTLAVECAPHIQVNAIAPGTIIFPENPPDSHRTPLNRVPLQRYSSAAEITELALWLATTHHSMTGQTIPIDGGRTLGSY
ncbi:SDR family oxidoreductase [bacterium]|nr:SDR family oxidoreductase [bacterium]